MCGTGCGVNNLLFKMTVGPDWETLFNNDDDDDANEC